MMATNADVRKALRNFGLENDRLDAVVAHLLDAPQAEFKAMDHLQAQGQLTPSQLADRLALTSGAVTALLDRLERLGWCTRRRHSSDRRSVVIEPVLGESQEGLRAYAPYADAIDAAAGRLTKGERNALLRFLDEASEIAHARADELKREGLSPPA